MEKRPDVRNNRLSPNGCKGGISNSGAFSLDHSLDDNEHCAIDVPSRSLPLDGIEHYVHDMLSRSLPLEGNEHCVNDLLSRSLPLC